MGLLDLFKRSNSSEGNQLVVRWQLDPAEGVDFIVPSQALDQASREYSKHPLFIYQTAALRQVHEQGLAIARPEMYSIKSEDFVEFEDDFYEIFDLPEHESFAIELKLSGNSTRSDFTVNATLVLEDGQRLTSFQIAGPLLQLGHDIFRRLERTEYAALSAINHHQNLANHEKTEFENLTLIKTLQDCRSQGLAIDLAQFSRLDIIKADKIGVAATAMRDGSLMLSPTFGASLEQAEVETRLGQLAEDGDTSLRVKNKFVLFNEASKEAVAEILTNRRIAPEQVEAFLQNPGSFINASLIDLDTGFSLRVLGAEVFEHKYFGEIESNSQDWFGLEEANSPAVGLTQVVELTHSEAVLEELAELITDAHSHNAQIIEHESRKISLEDAEDPLALIERKIEWLREQSTEEELDAENTLSSESQFDEQPQKAVVGIESNDLELEFSGKFANQNFDPQSESFRTDNLKRLPFQHQTDGIRWLLEHLSKSSQYESGGALLADDMGLGKTFMTLVAIGESIERQKNEGITPKPTLIVAPLSLLENWKDEVFKTFKESPFDDIVVLQADNQLNQFKIRGSRGETLQNLAEDEGSFKGIRFALKVGPDFGPARLDQPNRLVLATYQTLRDYQFSLGRIDWGIVTFDEAQNIKNPNAMQSRAAKALKADFKLLATGTPVENSLKDFWCLMDTCTPGLLGSWQEFRNSYIEPIVAGGEDSDIKNSIGSALRKAVGEFMLRRTKEECLDGLPEKTIWAGVSPTADQRLDPSLLVPMPQAQEEAYDEVLEVMRALDPVSRAFEALSALNKLRVISLHPILYKSDSKFRKPNLGDIEDSAKFQSVFRCLEAIKLNEEKAIIFAISKAAQRLIAALVTFKYGIEVSILNGDTKTQPSKSQDESRLGLIKKFENQQGFGVIVMSPVAAGVGLTVIGANHVIHLERHYNPAKEAQATDRVYRIGQERPVHVYLPMARHSTVPSFDERLHNLLKRKTELSASVMVPQVISDMDLINDLTATL